MPPPARGCLRSDGLAPGGQAGVAGAALARREQQEQPGAARADACSKGRARIGGGAGRHEATCHPRLGGACEAMALRWESRRGSPVPPWLAGCNKSRRVQQGQPGSRKCCLGTPRAARADACSKGSRAWRRAGGVSRCSIRGCPRDGDGCRPSGSGCSSRPCARRNTHSCHRSRAAGPAGTGSRIVCWRE